MEQGLNPWFSTHKPWDPGQLGRPLRASVSPSAKRLHLRRSQCLQRACPTLGPQSTGPALVSSSNLGESSLRVLAKKALGW